MAVRIAVELHEDEIPDLDISSAFTGKRTAGVPEFAGFRAKIVMDFGARSTWPGFTHLPEVVFLVQADDSIGRDARTRTPQLSRRIVLAKNGDPEFVGGQAEFFCQKRPGIVDRFLLEVRAKGKIAQHLEKRLMPARMPDVIEVIMFAAGPNAFLAARGGVVGALFPPEKNVLELVHARIDKQQRRVLSRNQRGAFDDGVATVREELEESPANLIAVHRCFLFPLEWRPPHIQDDGGL